jgi:hypothetical protein
LKLHKNYVFEAILPATLSSVPVNMNVTKRYERELLFQSPFVRFRFHRGFHGPNIIYMTALVYITYMLALLDFTLLYIGMKNACWCWWWDMKKVHKRASRVTRLCWKFMGFRREVLSFYLYVYTLYSLSFLALKTLVSLSYNIIYMCLYVYIYIYILKVLTAINNKYSGRVVATLVSPHSICFEILIYDNAYFLNYIFPHINTINAL